jgi:hypothetical protein
MSLFGKYDVFTFDSSGTNVHLERRGADVCINLDDGPESCKSYGKSSCSLSASVLQFFKGNIPDEFIWPSDG